jgi:hypothetical protein
MDTLSHILVPSLQASQRVEGFTSQPPKLANPPKLNFTITTTSDRRNKSIFVIYDSNIVILEILGIF